ncbi:hypothetical protein Cgig2_013171 [Carnegiea gigantea]|uniref:Alpha/beta hydrolase fold-3 domain-containing protein n=1 Tax=Carnegiea gigantea TaxID=171969 RepID=A0A9Q1KPM9_9CARY|nr:hypothetical protein Cgig2_013171 [Carnegiea gigantea]
MAKFDPYEHLRISLNSDGSLQRFNVIPKVSANPNAPQGEGVTSKDVTINAETNVWARIYCPSKLPSNDQCVARLPIVIYLHSGGFIKYSVSDIFSHERCNQYSREIPAIMVALEYRLAPEHKLPAQYEDAVDLLVWIQNQSKPNGDQWLKDYADFSRCYLLGRDSGANIAYNASLRVADLDLKPLKIAGIILNQPMLGGMRRTKSELKYACDEIVPLPCWDLMWELALPKGTDRDHGYCNPMKDPAQKAKTNKLGRCMS